MNCQQCGKPISGIMAEIARESGTQLCGGRDCETQRHEGFKYDRMMEAIERLNVNTEALIEAMKKGPK